MWDFAGLNECEDRTLFRTAPTQYNFGRPGTTLHIEQRRLPDETRPEDTGSEVWPAAVALARYIERETLRTAAIRVASMFEEEGAKIPFGDLQRATDTVMGRSIIELGAGMGLVGLAARALGARRVLLTDIEDALPGLKRNLDLNPSLNGSSKNMGGVEVAALDWRTAASCISSIVLQYAIPTNRWKGAREWAKANCGSMVAFDLILCSDCVVWPELSGPLRATLTNLVHDGNAALLSVVHRCHEADEFPQTLRCHFSVQEVWSSPAKGKQPEGHIKIYRARRKPRRPLPTLSWKHEREVTDLLACLEAAKTTEESERTWTFRSLEYVVGAKRGSLGEFKATAGNFRFGAHATSCRLSLVLSNDARKCWKGNKALSKHMTEECNVPPSIFVKRVVPAELQERHSGDWAQGALGYLTELNFYRVFAEVLRERGAGVPRCYAAWDYGREKLEEALEQYDAFGSSNAEQAVCEELMRCRFVVVMEDFASPRWEQHLFLSEPRARAALGLLADLHAASMGDQKLLEQAQKELRPHGGYWATSLRDPSELSRLEVNWENLVFQLFPLDEELFEKPGVVQLAARLLKALPEVDREFRGGEEEAEEGEVGRGQGGPGLSILHGDLRANHLFFSTGCGSNLEVQKLRSAQRAAERTGAAVEEAVEAAVLGFRWSGVGAGAQDVAHLLICSAELALLEDGPTLRWLITTSYLEPLHRRVGPKVAPTPKEFFRTFRLACLDYAKVAIGHHLVAYDPARVRKGKLNMRRPAHNRSLRHTLGFIRFLDRLLDGEEVPGYGSTDSVPRATPAVVIDGASGPDAPLVNGAYELQSAFKASADKAPLFKKLDAGEETEEVWLYLAENGTWCVSSAANKDARASACWAHSEPSAPGALLLPSTARLWRVTSEDDWERQELRILPRVLLSAKEGAGRKQQGEK